MRCARTSSRRPMSGVPCFPARSQRSDEVSLTGREQNRVAPVSHRTRRRRDSPLVCCHTANLGLPHTLRVSPAVALERVERAGAQGALALSFCVRATPPYVTSTHGSDCRLHRSKAARDSSAPSVHRCGAFMRNEPSSRTSVHAAASCSPGLSRTTLHSRRGSFAAMHALGTVAPFEA